MFKHCLSKFSRALVFMCALVTGGLLHSCFDELDEYKYDDSEPTWLGASIYDRLKEGTGDHTYQNYVNIIEDLGLKEVLARTGSKTLFIADDDAFEEFYADNSWGVSSYAELSQAQKKVILYNSMLDNAYLLDMLSSRQGNPPIEGSCLRRTTSAAMMDTVAYFYEDAPGGFHLPKNNAFFDPFRPDSLFGNGLRVVVGASDPMMVHFLGEYLSNNHVENSDFDIFFNGEKGRTDEGNESFIFDKEVVSSGIDLGEYSDDDRTIICKNGYMYRLDGVLVPPSDMAQELRKHPDTQLFSRMLDRFAYPLWGGDSKSVKTTEGDFLQDAYDKVLGQDKNTPDRQYVHTIKYSTETENEFNAYTDFQNNISEKKNFNGVYLPYDPGFTQYAGSNGKEADMAAMLVPNDEMIYRFFAPEAYQDASIIAANNALPEEEKRPYAVGAAIVERYGKDAVQNLTESDYMSIAACLDSIPLHIVQAFIANLMKASFLGTLPSNFDKVTNDARDPMGITPADVEECVVANNGVIYILNNVFGPAKYQAVMTPPLIMENMRIMNKVIGDLTYDAYLLAMDSYFSFIVPDDEYFIYYDPVSLSSTQPLAWKFRYGKRTEKDKEDYLWADTYKFDPVTYELGDSVGIAAKKQYKSNEKIGETQDVGNRLHDLMEYLIIVDNIEDGNQYYLTKGYGTVKCAVKGNVADNTLEVKFYGGEQVELGTEFPGVDVKQRFTEKNGVTYCTHTTDANTHGYKSGVVSPPTKSVNSYVGSNENFSEFYKVCDIVSADLLKQVFPLADAAKVEKDSLKKYSIFYQHKTKNECVADLVVPFFSTYHYSVYVPTNKAIQDAYALGLPTYEEIEAEVAAGNEGRAASIIRMINKFARYHFQDNAVYVDTKPFSVTSAGVTYDTVRYETAAIDDATGRFFETIIKSEADDNGGHTITIRDNLGRKARIINTPGEEHKSWNILARDLYLKGTDPAAATQITTSSFAVIHQIDSALYNTGILGYDGRFRRFATDGELVDQIFVGEEKVPYLIGYRNSLIFDTAEGEKYQKTGYIMKPSANKTKLSQEEYVTRTAEDGTEAKILITEDGYLINEEAQFIHWDGRPLAVDTLGYVIGADSIVKVGPDGLPIK